MKWFWVYALVVALLSFGAIKYLFPLINFDPSRTVTIVFTSIMNAVFSIAGVYLQQVVALKNQKRGLKLSLEELISNMENQFAGKGAMQTHEKIKMNSNLKNDPQFKTAVEYCRKSAFDLRVQKMISEEDYGTVLAFANSCYTENKDLQPFIQQLSSVRL